MHILQSQDDNAIIYFIFSLMPYSLLLNYIHFFFIIETYCSNCANFLSDIVALGLNSNRNLEFSNY